MKAIKFLAILFLSFQVCASEKIFQAKYLESNGERRLLFRGFVPGNPDSFHESVREVRYPQWIIEHNDSPGLTIVELLSPNSKEVDRILAERQVIRVEDTIENQRLPEGEVFTIVENGKSSNRLDLVFMGDGYQENEKAKFLADVKRLTKDMFDGRTYRSYLPLFNVYAVFKSSKESGIGRNDIPKNTAYRLYRQGNTLRAIFPGDKTAIRQSCRLAPGCDYPIVVGNDDYYGGLGGEFAITTRSETSGTIVLRHELGHNFGIVGEEYDGGGYFGANYSRSLSTLKWKHWVSKSPEAEPSVARFLDWPWHPLKSGAFKKTFQSDGKQSYTDIRFSASGFETDDTLELRIDGKEIAIKSSGYKDRAFHDLLFNSGLTSGKHEIAFSERVKDGDNWLSSLTIHEYGAHYHFEASHIGAYPVFLKNGSVAGYRSNHNTCLMRNMRSDLFCSICRENMWMKFLAKVTLIDGVEVKPVGDQVRVQLKLPPLGQFRSHPLPGEKVAISWLKDGKPVPELADKPAWSRPKTDVAGSWKVEVEFETSEVKKDPSGLLKSTRGFKI